MESKFTNRTVNLRIKSLLDLIAGVEKDLDGVSYNEFATNDVLLRATSFSILQKGEIMGKLEQQIGDLYPKLPWKVAKSMRNILAHDYENADSEIIYKTAKVSLPKLYKDFLKIYEA